MVPTLVFEAVDYIYHATTASGLLWISELIEEHSKFAKVLGKRGIYVRVQPSHLPLGINITVR